MESDNDIDMDEEIEITEDNEDNSGRGSPNANKDGGENMNSTHVITGERKKKTRTVFSRSQVFQLESTFDMKRYLSSSERAGLAASLHLTEVQVGLILIASAVKVFSLNNDNDID